MKSIWYGLRAVWDHDFVHCSPTQYLADIEEHLGVTIPTVSTSFEVPVNEYDGQITYGEAKRGKGLTYEGHIAQLAPSVTQLAKMEKLAQTTFLSTRLGKQKWFL